MSVHDPYPPAGDGADDLPPLPIPRPGEWSPLRPTTEEPVSAPRLLGASFTAASTDADAPATGQAPAPSSSSGPSSELDRLPWDLAAQLTAGMLANPGRAHASVKDAIGLFDQLLHELHAYARMAVEHDLHSSEQARRQSHGDYFHRHGERAGDDHAAPTEPPRSAMTPPPHVPKPAPTQPRPAGGYAPIPPGARQPYSPGSMAGAPPVDDVEPGSHHAA